MSIITYIGAAQPTIDIWTFTPGSLGSPPTSNLFTITCNGKSYTYTALVGDTVASICTALQALLSASTFGEFTQYTWTATSTTVVGTRNAIGIPGTFTQAHGNGGGAGTPTFTAVNTVAATSANDVGNTADYSGAALPVNSDTLIVDSQSPSLLYNASALSGVTLTLLDIRGSFTGAAGLPVANPLGYREYLPTQFTVSATTIKVGAGGGQGSGRLRLNVGSVQTALQVFATGSSLDSGVEALQFAGSSTSNTLDISGGTVGIAPYGGDAGKFSTITISAGSVHCYESSVIVSVTQSGGAVQLDSGFSGSYVMSGGSATIIGAITSTALTIGNGTVVLGNVSGTVTTITLNPGGTLDLSQDVSAFTATGVVLNGGTVIDPANRMTVTNGYSRSSTVRQISAA